MSKTFCKTCDICTGGVFTKLAAKLEYWVAVAFTLGLYAIFHYFRPKCPHCDHKMIYHRGQSTYWRKKQK